MTFNAVYASLGEINERPTILVKPHCLLEVDSPFDLS